MYALTKEKVSTRYVLAGIRILVDPENPQDLQEVHALQDAIKLTQSDSGKFETPKRDPVSQKKVREALLTLAEGLPDTKGMFGSKEEVDPVRCLIGSASAWGGNPEKDALYLKIVPPGNDGKTMYRLHVRNVPVDGFWSISV